MFESYYLNDLILRRGCSSAAVFQGEGTMKTVNELAFGMKTVSRTKAEQELYIGVLRETADVYVERTVHDVNNKLSGKLKNCGETSLLELMGALGIWLSQFSDTQTELITMARRGRQQSEAVWALIGK